MPLPYESPDKLLAAELEEVSADADLRKEQISSANYLPDEFPAKALIDLCGALSALKDGTAEGCKQPLTFAKFKLPNIRRVYFLLREDEDTDEP